MVWWGVGGAEFPTINVSPISASDKREITILTTCPDFILIVIIIMGAKRS